jgi:hypothetical protein
MYEIIVITTDHNVYNAKFADPLRGLLAAIVRAEITDKRFVQSLHVIAPNGDVLMRGLTAA